MLTIHGHRAELRPITIGARTYEIYVPLDADALLDDPEVVARFERDEYMPYWATLWPGALLLAEFMDTWQPERKTPGPLMLELGCGLGLVSVVAAARGHDVIASDYDGAALAFVAANCKQNDVALRSIVSIDWRMTYDAFRPSLILAADVLYEARYLDPVARFVRQHLAPGGTALIADAFRSTADAFPAVVRAHDMEVSLREVTSASASAPRPLRGRLFTLRHACVEAR